MGEKVNCGGDITIGVARACRVAPPINPAPTEVPVTVRLFGILALLARERLIQLRLPQGATVGDVLERLGDRFGADFFARIVRVPGQLHTYCSVFADGRQVDDVETKIASGPTPAEVSIILFMASEGG